MFLPGARALAIVGIACAVLATSACIGTHDGPAAGPIPVTTPSDSSTPSTPVPSQPATTSPVPLAETLLSTAQMPGLNPQWRWADGTTGPAGTEAFGPCARFSLLDIGATTVLQRSYLDPHDSSDSATEQVADFADRMTALRAQKTLQAWHRSCRAQITGATRVQVGPDTTVDTPADAAGWYLVSSLPEGAEANQYNAFGYVLEGARIALLRIDNDAQAHSYRPGAEPMVAAVKAAADRLS